MTGAGPRSSRGVALIAVLLVSSLVFVVGTGLALMAMVGQLVARNHREAATLLAAAEGAIDLAAAGLETTDWSAVLAGATVAALSDGLPGGTRAVEGEVLDLAAETHWQNCGRRTSCVAADLVAVSAERPWGANNPVWRPFLFGPLATFGPYRWARGLYVLVWVGDDGRETDGRPDIDGQAESGRHVIRARAMAVGRGGGRRIVDAELVRVCLDGRAACEPGIHVQSQREIRHAVP